MPSLLALLSLAAAATPEELLAQGVAAVGEKDLPAATAAFRTCVEQAPDNADCRWELGWMLWNDDDWAGVVEQWSRVEALQPDRPDLRVFLDQARAHVALLERARTSPPTPRAPLPPGTTLRLRAVGDLMIGSDFPSPNFPPQGPEHELDEVRELLADADLTFGNLEGPLCDGGRTEKCKPGENCYAFRTPTRYAATYAEAGFDLLSNANNHAEDFGPECRLQTEKALADAGMVVSGRPGTIAVKEVDGHRVALVAFHSNPNSNYINDEREVKALVGMARSQADWVIVSFHGGAEGSKATHVPDKMEIFYDEKRGHLRRFARTAIGAGADLVLGHGPHVWRGMELVDGHLVVYSMGNFATFGSFRLTGPLGFSGVLEVTLGADGKLVSGKLLPTLQHDGGIPAPDPANQVIAAVKALSEADFPQTAPAFQADGTFLPR
ncbi:MAG: CapA family protein [Alphaproteobacteria bacterium]|nr:CapA family protein [Alphaproteobacteria bacterium]MCB9699809.1 CapA family protein [Alphaproteobacteria bacterium]